MKFGSIRDRSYNDLFFWNAIKRNRLEVLNIDAEEGFRYLTNFELKLANAPNPLKELILKHNLTKNNSFKNEPQISLSSLKNLEKLSLSLPPNLKLWKALLPSIPNQSQLIKLHLDIPGNPSRFYFIYFHFARKQPG